MELFKNGDEWNLPVLVYANDAVLVAERKSDDRMF